MQVSIPRLLGIRVDVIAKNIGVSASTLREHLRPELDPRHHRRQCPGSSYTSG
jgi:hypothetical protein